MHIITADEYAQITLRGVQDCMVGSVVRVAGSRAENDYKIIMQFAHEGQTTLIGCIVEEADDG